MNTGNAVLHLPRNQILTSYSPGYKCAHKPLLPVVFIVPLNLYLVQQGLDDGFGLCAFMKNQRICLHRSETKPLQHLSGVPVGQCKPNPCDSLDAMAEKLVTGSRGTLTATVPWTAL